MRRSLLLSTAALTGALGLGCDDRPGVNDPSTGVAPSFGATVTRFETPFILSLSSGGPDITALFGVSFEDFPALCAGAEPQAVAEAMIVTHPTRDGGTAEHVQITAKELSAIVWPVDLGPGGDACSLQGVQPLVGTVHLTLNDNEGEFFETAPGANAVVIRVVGTVTNPDTGQRYHIQGAIQIVILPDGTFKFLPVPFLRLTPIGG